MNRTLVSLLILASAAPALAADEATAESGSEISVYAVAGIATTAAYVPNSGPASGPLGDVSPTVGVGVYLTEKLCLELDAGVTFTAADGYTTVGFGPALIWAFHPNVYAAGRLFVPVDPAVNLVVLPGIGLTQVFDNGLAPFVELDLASAIGRGQPDLAIVPSAGASVLIAHGRGGQSLPRPHTR
jgi:hypothetical protein